MVSLRANEMGLAVSDDTLRTMVTANPAFQAAGQFDRGRFEQVLRASGELAPSPWHAKKLLMQVGIKGYEWYWKNPQPAIRPNLQACASDNFFFEASDAAQLSAEFKKMFKKAVQATNARLSK